MQRSFSGATKIFRALLSRTKWLVLLLAFLLVACGGNSGSPVGGDNTAAFAFQPITIQRIDLPDSVQSAGWPVFTNDGQHLLFFSTAINISGGSTGKDGTTDLWITELSGQHAHCLTCNLANSPSSHGEGVITPFPDGKRVFFGSFLQPGGGHYSVLECSPSVADCATAKILPVDYSDALPSKIPPGGAVSKPKVSLGGAYSAKLSQDGVHIGFSNLRFDTVEAMVVGTLKRTPDKYIVVDPRVINPPAPTSASDTDVTAWSSGGALYEFKTFAHGGAYATYVEAGGYALGNPDVWSVNLKTGQRTRLTAHPGYDEDNAVSPNGKLLALWSNRTMHLSDWYGGILPVRDFIFTPAALMGLTLNSSDKFCHGTTWILPASGDQGSTLAGQPIVDSRLPANIIITNNLVGWPQWSPDGTMLALNTTDTGPTGTSYPNHAPFLLVAHFTALKPGKPLPAVSSQPGDWTVPPTNFHPAMGFSGVKIFPGAKSGKVTIHYAGSAVTGHWSETYQDYSNDGKSFVNGTVTIDSPEIQKGTYSSHLAMTGEHTGSVDVDMNFTGAGPQGEGVTTFDGNTIKGPSPQQLGFRACPHLRPKEPALQVKKNRIDDGAYRIRVTASIAGAGLNEAKVDTRPVYHARLELGGETVYTDRQGRATVHLQGAHQLHVSAGDTLVPATVTLH